MKQLLSKDQPYNIILGARNTTTTQVLYDILKFDATHNVTVLPLELASLSSTKTFAQRALENLGGGGIDYLFLNAGTTMPASAGRAEGSRWCESYVVNVLCAFI